MSNAYTEQFEKLINDQLLDMDAELKVMENTIKADGFDVKKQDRTQEIKSGFSYRRKNCMHDKPMQKMRWQLKHLPEKFLIVMKFCVKISCWRSRNFIWRFWRT